MANKKCNILAFNDDVCVRTTSEQKEMSTALRKHTQTHILLGSGKSEKYLRNEGSVGWVLPGEGV